MEAVPSAGTSLPTTSVYIYPYRLDIGAATSFVGHNFAKYWSAWTSMSTRASKASWHWPAFFLGPIWMGYRRMHAEAFASLTLLAVATIFVTLTANGAGQEGSAALPATILVNLACMVLFGVFANFLYFRRTAISIRTVQETNQILESKGGSSTWPAVAWAIPTLALGLFSDTAFRPPVATLTAAQQNAAYFVPERFRNPHLMRSVFEQTEGDVHAPLDARLINAFYVKYAIDRIKETCGWQPTGLAAVAKGTLDIGEGALLTAHTLGSVQKLFDSEASSAVVGWLQGINGIDTIRQYARGDVDRFLTELSIVQQSSVTPNDGRV